LDYSDTCFESQRQVMSEKSLMDMGQVGEGKKRIVIGIHILKV